MLELAIIIVNYNSADLTIDCVESILADDSVPQSTRIVVADNASPSNDAATLVRAAALRGWSDRVCVIALPDNGGFAVGNNRAIEAADGKFGPARFYLLLNPDTVCRPSSIATLVDFMHANPGVGISGSRLEDPDGTRQACAFRFPTPGSELESTFRFGPVTRMLRQWQVAPELPETASPVDWVSGASMLVRREVFEAIGKLDESYFLYYEELDFCLRAARAGWPAWHVPQSRVIHLVGQSSGVTRRTARPARRPAYWFRSRRHYFVKNHGRAYALSADIAWLAGQVGFHARQLVSPTDGRDPPRLLLDFVRHSWLARETG